MYLYRYLIKFTATRDGDLPGFLGNTLRGSFGQTLYKNDKDLYTLLFEKNIDKNHPVYSIVHNTPPAPFAIYPYHNRTRYRAGDELKFVFTIFGDYHRYAGRIYTAWEQTGANGIGSAKIPFQLVEIKSLLCLHNQKTKHDLDDCRELKMESDLVNIKFQSPALLYADKRIINNFSFDKIFGYIDRRLYVLDQLYGNGDYVQTDELPKIDLVKIDLIIKNTYRKPKKESLQGKPAWKGSLTYRLPDNTSPVYQIIYFGQFIQIGTGTAYGYGKYKIE